MVRFFKIFNIFLFSLDFFCSLFIRNKINLNEISHDSAIGLITRVLNIGVLLTEVKFFMTYMDSWDSWYRTII